MYRTVIVGYDGTEAADDAIALARAIAEPMSAELTVVGVVPEERGGDERQPSFAAALEEVAGRIGAHAKAYPSSSPARGLHEVAEELEADLIVVGSSRSTGLRAIGAGSVATQVLHGAPCAVALAPRGASGDDNALHEIGVALDGSDESEQALAAAVEIARATRAALRLVTVAEGGSTAFGWGYGIYYLSDIWRDELKARLEKAAAQVPQDVTTTLEPVTYGVAAERLEQVSRAVDLLCVGSRAYGPVRRVLLGSVSTQLARHAAAPLLVVPRGTRSAEPLAETAPAGGS